MSTMSSVNVPLLYWFDGTLTIDNNPMHVNRVVKLVIVRKSITRHELVEKIHQTIKINLNKHQRWALDSLICNWLVAQGQFQTVGISDDDDTWAMLELYSIVNSIELYVEKDTLSLWVHGEFTHMLNLDNESTSFMSRYIIHK